MGTYWEPSKDVATYVITELELNSLDYNIHVFSQLLNHHYFEVLVNYKAKENINKFKKEPSTGKVTAIFLKFCDYTST